MLSITDGEFRRAWFHLDFLQQLDGVAVTGSIAASSDAATTVHLTPPKLSVVGPLRHPAQHPGGRLRLPELGDDADADGVDPVPDDGPLQRRARRHRPGRVSRPVTSKRPELEPYDELASRIDEASAYVPLERLCLRPQCGFASTIEGNALTADEQWAKLAHVVDTAARIWA